ncbi:MULTISPECIES: response regulator transcription factor [unclassified Luteimonas]|uniref:response regulator transcription factor n=1 Tax=unclassified Luteimonas TaxID=2629088 RepID=UPI0018F06CA2|nr:response regulator transcription factor [Luteimonas sp. MC1750]MBJ6979104.1 response regulator transcription factor [Luteimonas sp. MC1895]MBJ6985120.1 response regulator transcription factor [Luteimonas sp. MC1750]QQO05776.1 response regulator transcription factor [Luteimonas sp. MC1750]
MATLLIADDHPLFREALRGAVARVLPEATLKEADSVEKLYALVESEPDADLLLLDLNMPGAQGFSALVHLRAQHPELPVVVVSAREEPAVMRRALDHGAMGFIPKSADSGTLGRALAQVLQGDRWAPPAALAAPAADADEHDAAQRVAGLTPQQFRVLQMLGAGLLNKQIAFQLGVSEATIKAHMTAILRKLGASNRTQAVLIAGKLALEPGAITPQPDEGD